MLAAGDAYRYTQRMGKLVFFGMLRFLLAGSAVALLPPVALAGGGGSFETGNKLYEICTHTDPRLLEYADCLGYTSGIADMLSLNDNITGFKGLQVCLPAEVTRNQIKDVAIRSLAAHPESRHLPAAALVAVALAEAFPCK